MEFFRFLIFMILSSSFNFSWVPVIKPGVAKNNIFLEWDPPSSASDSSKLKYEVTYINLGKNLNFCKETSSFPMTKTAVGNEYTISGLEPYSKYKIDILAKHLYEENYVVSYKSIYVSTLGFENLEGDELQGVSIGKLKTRGENISFEIENVNCSKIQGNLRLKNKIVHSNYLIHEYSQPLNDLTITYNASLKSPVDYTLFSRLCRDVCKIVSTKEFQSYKSPQNVQTNVNVEWHKNNTLELFWDISSGWVPSTFEIRIFEEHRKDSSNYNVPANGHSTSLSVTEVFQYARTIIIYIIAENVNAEFHTSSYPPIPNWMNKDITSESDGFTITLKFKINKDNTFLSARSLFILISVNKPNYMDLENVQKLAEILNIDFYDLANTRIVANINLLKQDVTNLSYQIGKESFQRKFEPFNSDFLSHIKFDNRNLKKNHNYSVTILPVNEFRGKYAFQKLNLNLSTTTTISKGIQGKIDSSNDITQSGKLWEISLIILVCAVLAVFVCLYRKKMISIQKKILQTSVKYSTKNPNNPNNILMNIEETVETNISFSTNEYEEIQENVLNSVLANRMNSKEVEVQNYEEYVKRSIENGELQKQHALFTKSPINSYETGKSIENRLKNRYNNLIAYDHSRVKLDIKADSERSDYINANYINDNNEKKTYIATQGPLPQTIEDFWIMVWQERVKVIVMLANILEDGKKRVEQYWPQKDEKLIFGNICIRYRSVELFADYDYRIFSLTCDGEMRQVQQIHFTAWPGSGIPLYPHTLVPIIKRMQKITPSLDSTILVHCSAGVGRTGTILLCDICMRMATQKGVVDMLQTLSKLREQRPNMVDNDEQYKLSHLVVLECLTGLCTDIKCDSDLQHNVRGILNGNEHKIQMHYLEEIMWRDEAMKSVADTSKHYENYPEKDREKGIVPKHQERICLSKYPIYDESSSYINAVLVHGYRSPGKFIVTQQPMPTTLGDFWRLVVEKKSRFIVSLNEIDYGMETACKFWPSEDVPEIHPVDYMSVIFVNVVDLGYYEIYTVNMLSRKNEEEGICIKIYSFKNWWAGTNFPTSCEEFLSMMENIEGVSCDSRHIIVTCWDGARASGIYVSLSFIIERIKAEEMCDICLSVRRVRHNRKEFIVNEAQFAFLYQAAAKWMELPKISSS